MFWKQMGWCVVAGIMMAGSVAVCGAQDVVKIAPQHNKVRFENEHVRVIETTLAPGEKDPLHTYVPDWYYVTKPGQMKIVFDDCEVQAWEAREGDSGWMTPSAPESMENVGKTTVEFVLVEVKSTAKAGAK